MATQSANLHQDQEGKRTSAVWSSDGTGTNRWLLWGRNAILELLARTEDAAAASGDRGIMTLAVRRDTPASGVSADGDYAGLGVDSSGYLYVDPSVAFDEDAAHTTGDRGALMLAVRRDTAAVGSSADGDYSTLNVDDSGRLRTVSTRDSTDKVSIANTTALATNLVVKASAGVLHGIVGYSTATQFIQVHDSTSLPADTAVPELVIPIEADKPFNIPLPGHDLGTGIVVCNSTTGPTKTIGSANTWITAYYE